MLNRRLALLFLIAISMALPRAASATVIQGTFTGVTGLDAPVTGTFSYDSVQLHGFITEATPLEFFSNASAPSNSFTYSLTFNGTTIFEHASSAFLTISPFGTDLPFQIFDYTITPPQGQPDLEISIAGLNLFTDLNDPASVSFNLPHGGVTIDVPISIGDSHTNSFAFLITSISAGPAPDQLSATPLPPAALMFGSGLVVLAGLGWSRALYRKVAV
jgi:hypothetical protein